MVLKLPIRVDGIYKGNNSTKTVGGVMVVVFCPLIMLHICTTFHENISKVFSVTEQT